MKTQVLPIDLSSSLMRLEFEVPQNQCIMNLKAALDYASVELITLFNSLGVSKVIPLIGKKSSVSAKISIPFYVGNSLLLKVTPTNYLGKFTDMPLVLPPFYEASIGGKERKDGTLTPSFTVRAYPLLRTNNAFLGEYHNDNQLKYIIDKMLPRLGLEFNRQDDRLDNIAELPDGEFCLIDDDCVFPFDANKVSPASKAKWQTKIVSLFPDLYTSPNPANFLRQTSESNFEICPRAMGPQIRYTLIEVGSEMMPRRAFKWLKWAQKVELSSKVIRLMGSMSSTP